MEVSRFEVVDRAIEVGGLVGFEIMKGVLSMWWWCLGFEVVFRWRFLGLR